MNSKDNKAAAPATAAGAATGSLDPVKEKIFSIIRKASEEGITDGRRRLWIDFAPHVAIEQREDGFFVVWLWRGCVVVKIILDNEFNVVGFDVERP
jgi:hypothetical protein